MIGGAAVQRLNRRSGLCVHLIVSVFTFRLLCHIITPRAHHGRPAMGSDGLPNSPGLCIYQFVIQPRKTVHRTVTKGQRSQKTGGSQHIVSFVKNIGIFRLYSNCHFFRACPNIWHRPISCRGRHLLLTSRQSLRYLLITMSSKRHITCILVEQTFIFVMKPFLMVSCSIFWILNYKFKVYRFLLLSLQVINLAYRNQQTVDRCRLF